MKITFLDNLDNFLKKEVGDEWNYTFTAEENSLQIQMNVWIDPPASAELPEHLKNVPEDKLKQLEQLQKRELEYEIAIKMQEQGLEKVSNDLCTISVKAEMVPSVQDWDAVHQHIIDTNQFELLQKRMSATAWRELAKMGMEVPGVVGTELTRVNYRSK